MNNQGLFCLRILFAIVAVSVSHLHAQTMRVPSYKPPSPVIASTGTTTPSEPSGKHCWWRPTRGDCMDNGDKDDNINAFFDTEKKLSYFNQIKSIYNRASSSATVSADLATLNFSNGMQMTAGTNVQAGSSSAAAVSAGKVPTLSGPSAGQATQNMLYGGTITATALYPLIYKVWGKVDSKGGLGISADLLGREGIDLQNFKSGTNTTVDSPPSHTSVQVEGYLQYNSINSSSTSKTNANAGAIFVGGSYGYGYMSHGYARDYGFGNNVSNGVGQVSVGMLISGVATISLSRAFGPSQTYIDSTSMVQTTVNNFKAWSFGISYQSSAK
jgi:hypothetical protein